MNEDLFILLTRIIEKLESIDIELKRINYRQTKCESSGNDYCDEVVEYCEPDVYCEEIIYYEPDVYCEETVYYEEPDVYFEPDVYCCDVYNPYIDYSCIYNPYYDYTLDYLVPLDECYY